MKKYLMLIRNESGQVLFFVLISASITIILFIGAVKVYISSVEESRFILEQIEVETIVQMSKADLLSLSENEDIKSFYQYIYPNGNINLNVTKVIDNRYIINNEVKLKSESIYQSAYEIEIEK